MTENGVKAEIIADRVQRTAVSTYKHLRAAFVALAISVVALTVGNVIGWTYVFQSNEQSCTERQEARDTIRRVFNAVFDEIEKANPDSDAALDRLQNRVEEELPPVNC